MQTLAPLDYAIVALYLIVVVAVALRVTRRSPDADELFLAGRTLGWGVIGLSLFASNISSTTLVGLPGAAWAHGISVANYEWMAALVLIVSLLFVVPLFVGRRIATVPELLERRFDARLRKYLSAVSVVLGIFLDAAGSLYAGSLVLQLFFPDLSLTASVASIALFAGLYTAAGGLRAVAYTDVLQALVLLVGSATLAVIVFGEFDYSWTRVVASVPADKLSLLRPLDDPALPWLGTLVGLPILGFYYWTMNQYVAQRLLGARDIKAASYGALFAAGLKLLPLFFMVLPGVMAISLLPDLDTPDRVFPTLVATYAPAGLAGLILAGLIAAIMSSVDSALNSSSTLLTLDFVQPRYPHLDVQAQARLGRIFTLVLVGVAALWAPAIADFPGLFAYLQQGFAYAASPLVAVFVIGLASRRVGATAAFYGTAAGHLCSVAGFAAAQAGWIDLHFTLVAGVLVAVTSAAIFALQYFIKTAPDAGQCASVNRSTLPRVPDGARWGSYTLIGITLAIVLLFR
ncbi:MAG: Na+/glucose cotransporter [Hydrogenophilales bacterium 16-64-46]|nr:MAG: Na+/glucose cotransporter [Hydrogenophilales bacterium 12-64-13]OYZ07097.1 MAG: Na+/glucose cotransporter [Hydrogenophilales bacterium 16-64-46]OZA37805.1 MAG: Na+/glucose cotransporter [Hydrogenophilales bacterium 17-64-34]HQS99241.1 sodium/solute symporter [Thiobacillus sp.]